MAQLLGADATKYRFAGLRNVLYCLNPAKRCFVASAPNSRVFQHMVFPSVETVGGGGHTPDETAATGGVKAASWFKRSARRFQAQRKAEMNPKPRPLIAAITYA